MASDNLNQVGKYIRKGGRDADQALKRFRKHLPRPERARDIITPGAPFTMRFETDNPQNRAIFTLKFNKPPPSDCTQLCYSSACEQFELAPGGHSLAMTNPYLDGTANVYIEGEPLDSVQWYEEMPSAGEVYVQMSELNIVVICYVFISC